jgi:4-hydroxy-3-methylbut-2-enyl diphosphate reductase
LLGECKKANPNTRLISNPEDIDTQWLDGVKSVGVCGATSTPKWLMEDVAKKVEELCSLSKSEKTQPQ